MRTIARAALIGVVLAAACAAPAAALGATITVTTTADVVGADGACGLREAITAANLDTALPGAGECAAGSLAGVDTVLLGAGVYGLSRPGAGEGANATGDLDIAGDVAIVGAGATATTIDARGIDRVITVDATAHASIDGVTITGGAAPAGAPGTSGAAGTPGAGGGAILNDGALAVSRSRIVGNAGGAGGAGGDAVGGVSPNGVDGVAVAAGAGGVGGSGGIESHGTLTLADTVLTGNRGGAGGAGGAAAGGATSAGPVGADGGDATGGAGGDGGAGGVAAAGTTTLLRSALLDNRSGAGGRGGDAQGGAAAGGGAGGDGGDATGGAGGDAGDGAGIVASGVLGIRESTIASNLTASGGQGGAAAGGARSDQAHVLGAGVGGVGGDGGDGGGIGMATGTIDVSDSTIAANLTGGGGGGGGGGAGILGGGPGSAGGTGGAGGRGGGVSSAAGLTAAFATIARNGAGADGSDGRAVDASAPGVTGSAGSPGSGSSAGVAVAGTTVFTSSILSGNGCQISPAPSDDGSGVAFLSPGCPGAAGDPLLGPLVDNGGPTVTMRPGAGSAALDRVPVAGCLNMDQRGALRPSGAGACDNGAVEVAPPVATTGGPGGIGATLADVGGAVDTRGLGAEYYVDFGPTTAYGGRTAGVAIAGARQPTGLMASLGGLSPGTTYHYRVVAIGPDGTSAGADRTFATPAVRTAAGTATPRLRILGLAVAPRSFAPLASGGVPRVASRNRPARGARISIRLSRRATVILAVQRRAQGRRVVTRGVTRCVAVRPGAVVKRSLGCTRYPTVGTVRRQGAAGLNSFVFTGRIGTSALRPGAYRLEATAVDVLGKRSAPIRVGFRVVSPVTAPRRG